MIPHKIRARRKGPLSKFHELSDSAYSFLAIPKPSWGNESFIHRYYKHILGRHFDAKGWTVEPEAKSEVSDHRFDLLATLSDEAIDIEITLNSKNLHDNIVNGFSDPRITKVMIVTEKDDLDRFKSKVAQDVTDYRDQLEFKPITDFLLN